MGVGGCVKVSGGRKQRCSVAVSEAGWLEI